MELLLNLVWCLLVAAAAVRFAMSERRVAVALATLCILALLFPIISVTDDLHSSPMLFEAPRGFFSVLAIVVAVVAITFALALIRAVASQRVHRVLDGVSAVISVRPPPVFVR
ncbi:MAG TPA: hypothetical protein VI258_06750 [Rhodanobacteraceae bacterium]